MKILPYLFLVLTMACGGADVPGSVDLGLEIQKQEAGNWCWAAVAQAIGSWHGENVTQSEVVAFTFNHPCTPETCNAPNNMKPYLASIGLGLRALPDDAIPNDAQLHEIISGGQPVIVRYRSPSGFAHFVLIGGYTPAGYVLYDSAFGESKTIATLTDYRDNWEVSQVLWVSQ